jgi:hypothetical protein
LLDSESTSGSSKEVSDITSAGDSSEAVKTEKFPGTITFNCPQGLTKYYKKEKPYPRKDGLITAYYICSKSQSTSKCTASIHLIYNPATNTTSTIVRRAHVPQCEQLIVKPEL